MHPPTLLTACSGVLVSALTVSALSAAPPQKDGDPVAIGTYRTHHSAILGEDRQLLVHVPADYDRTTLRYPVLFQLYGQQVTNYLASSSSPGCSIFVRLRSRITWRAWRKPGW